MLVNMPRGTPVAPWDFVPAEAEMQKRYVSRADEFDGTVLRCAADHEGGELARHGALRKDAVGGFHHAIERKVGVGETAERGVEMAHEHGRGDALAGNISEQEQQAAVGFEEIAIVAAHQAGRRVVVANLPSRRRKIARRE